MPCRLNFAAGHGIMPPGVRVLRDKQFSRRIGRRMIAIGFDTTQHEARV